MLTAVLLSLASASALGASPAPSGKSPEPASPPQSASKATAPRASAKTTAPAKKGIGYDSALEAQTKEAARKGVVVAFDRMGWMTVTNPQTHTLWSFAPEGTPVYPSAVRRVIVEKEGKVSITMDVLCQGDRKDCDGMVQSFQDLNAHIARDFQAQKEKASARSK